MRHELTCPISNRLEIPAISGAFFFALAHRLRWWPGTVLEVLAVLVLLGGFSATAEPVAARDPSPRFEDLLKIDVHVHVFDELPEFVKMLRRTNTRVVNICLGGNQPQLLVPCEKRAEQFRQQYSPQFGFAATFDVTRRNEPDYARQVISWLGETFQGGALMVKIWKDVGMELKTPTGAYLMPDDPVFDPIYAYLAKQRRPLMAHFADPIDAWRPLDPDSVHHAYYASHPEWHLYGKPGFPSHAEILAARDRMLAKHPDLVVIAAHLGSEAHDLDALAKRFDQFPNLYADVAARTPELKRQPPEKVRKFFIRYQDRLLYGTDADKYTEGRLPTPEEQAAFAVSMEKWYRGEFDYYAGQGRRESGRRETEGLGLPREVLEKFYHRNAQRLLPGLAAPPPPAPGGAEK
jgi:predicted TIM-barrel fold metal-dependent hydrolase